MSEFEMKKNIKVGNRTLYILPIQAGNYSVRTKKTTDEITKENNNKAKLVEIARICINMKSVNTPNGRNKRRQPTYEKPFNSLEEELRKVITRWFGLYQINWGDKVSVLEQCELQQIANALGREVQALNRAREKKIHSGSLKEIRETSNKILIEYQNLLNNKDFVQSQNQKNQESLNYKSLCYIYKKQEIKYDNNPKNQQNKDSFDLFTDLYY